MNVKFGFLNYFFYAISDEKINLSVDSSQLIAVQIIIFITFAGYLILK